LRKGPEVVSESTWASGGSVDGIVTRIMMMTMMFIDAVVMVTVSIRPLKVLPYLM